MGFDRIQIEADGYVKKGHPAIRVDLSSVVGGYTAGATSGYLRGEDINDYVMKVAGEVKVDDKNTVEGKP